MFFTPHSVYGIEDGDIIMGDTVITHTQRFMGYDVILPPHEFDNLSR
jgi:hypothetical protein